MNKNSFAFHDNASKESSKIRMMVKGKEDFQVFLATIPIRQVAKLITLIWLINVKKRALLPHFQGLQLQV